MTFLVFVLLFAPGSVEFQLDEVTLSLEVPPGWTKLDPEPVDGGEMLGRWRDDATGRLATLVKAPGNTEGAFDEKEAAAFFEGVERGVRLKTPDFHKISSDLHSDATPAKTKKKHKRLVVYDLWWRVPGAVRGARFLFFHGWSAVLVVEARGDKIDDALRALVDRYGAPQKK